MPNFLNSNPHHAYVDTGEPQLLKLRAFEEVEASGAAADRLEETPGIVNLDELSKEERATLDQRITDHKLAVEGAEPLGPDALAGSAGAVAADQVAEQEAAQTAADQLADRSEDDLRGVAKKLKLKGFKDMSREELIAALRELVNTTGEEETPAATEPPKSKSAPAPAKLPKTPPKVGKGSDTKSWAKFAKSLGLTVPDDAKRADLFKLVDKHLAKVERETKKAESGGGTVTSDKVPKKGQ